MERYGERKASESWLMIRTCMRSIGIGYAHILYIEPYTFPIAGDDAAQYCITFPLYQRQTVINSRYACTLKKLVYFALLSYISHVWHIAISCLHDNVGLYFVTAARFKLSDCVFRQKKVAKFSSKLVIKIVFSESSNHAWADMENAQRSVIIRFNIKIVAIIDKRSQHVAFDGWKMP